MKGGVVRNNARDLFPLSASRLSLLLRQNEYAFLHIQIMEENGEEIAAEAQGENQCCSCREIVNVKRQE